MKKVIIMLSLISLSSCVAYKIRINPVGSETYFTPMKRESGVWKDHYNATTSKSTAIEQIQIWKEMEKQQKLNNNPQYIKIK